MKKLFKVLIIFFVLLVIGTINLINLKAASTNMLKKLFVTIGSVDTLEYPGYKLIETNINYNVEGIYSATYVEDITDRKFTREIEVVSTDFLLNNGIKNINKLEEFKYENTNILKRVITPTCDVFVLENEEDLYLKYRYKDNSFDVLLFKSDLFGFVDMIFNEENNKLYLIGNLFTDSLDVYLAEYSLNGNLLKERVLKGNNVDTVKNIIINNNNIFLSGYTTSSSDDFNHTSYLEDSFVFKIDIDTFEINKYLNLGELGIDYINVSTYLDSLYVVKHYYNMGIPVVIIYKLDDDLNLISSKYLGTITLVKDINIKYDLNNLYYFCSVYNEELKNDEMVLYKITKDLSLKKLDTYYDPYAVGVDLNVINNEISLLYTSYSKNENYPTYIRTINDKKLKFTLDNRIYSRCYFNELGNLDLIYYENLNSFEYSLVFAKTFGSLNGLENINPVIMCNNSEITEDNYLSNLYFDKNLHGLYNLVYYYKFDFFDLVMRKDILVLNDINIDDDNIYTKGVILSFTGIGYLNNKKIDNGYVINEPGSYELNVIGYNNNLIYNFEVVESPISKELDSYVNQTINLKDLETEEKSIALVVDNPVTNKIIKSDYQNNIWYIVIPIVTLLVSISTFTLLGRKVK